MSGASWTVLNQSHSPAEILVSESAVHAELERLFGRRSSP
jgi:hypothetical protein